MWVQFKISKMLGTVKDWKLTFFADGMQMSTFKTISLFQGGLYHFWVNQKKQYTVSRPGFV